MDFRAQNNAQLFLQIHRSGCSSAELRLLRDAYTLAMQLYTGLFTGSGKTTLAHEVGTASLLHRHGGSIELVAAGLLHGAYLVGDWGPYRRGLSGRNRNEVRRVAGARVEAYIHGLTLLCWDSTSIAALADGAHGLPQRERDVLFLKLAEELDHLLDYGAILWFRNAAKIKADLRERQADICRLATQLGHPALSAELGEAIDLTLTTELPAELLGLDWPGDAAPLLIPRSCRRRRLWSLYRALSSGTKRMTGGVRRRILPAASFGAGRS